MDVASFGPDAEASAAKVACVFGNGSLLDVASFGVDAEVFAAKVARV